MHIQVITVITAYATSERLIVLQQSRTVRLQHFIISLKSVPLALFHLSTVAYRC